MASTTTPNLGLFKATPATGEQFRTSDVNVNMDKIDAAMGGRFTDFTPSTVNTLATEQQLMGTPIGPALQGSSWKITAAGTFGHTATVPTLTLRVKLGTVTAATIVITPPASALSGKAWRIDGELTCLTTGGSGTWKYSGLTFATVNATDTPFLSSPAAITKDTTVANTFEITAQWSVASVSNTVTIDHGQIYRLTNG